MSAQIYYVMHVLSAFLLTAFTFAAVSTAASGKDKRLLAITGILSLLMLTGGFGLMARLEYGFAENPWLFIKITGWLVLSAAAGLAYRKPMSAGLWGGLSVLAIVASVLAVYFKHAF